MCSVTEINLQCTHSKHKVDLLLQRASRLSEQADSSMYEKSTSTSVAVFG